MSELQAINDIWQRGVMATVISLLAILGAGIVVALVKPWLKRQYALMSAAWLRAPLSGKILLPLLVAVDVLAGGGSCITKPLTSQH